MTSLYNLSAEVAALKEKLEASDFDEQTIADTLEAESFDFEEKCRATAYVIKEFQASLQSMQRAIDEMCARQLQLQNKTKSLYSYLLDCMTLAGKKKIKGVEFDITVKRNPASVEIIDSGIIPERYWKVPEPAPAILDKRTLLKKLKEGENIPGCQLVQKERLEIE